MTKFTDKVIVVTGASEGIGRALCLALAPQRPRLVLAARNEGRLHELKLNYLGSVYYTYYALPYLKKTGGLIVAVSSVAGITGVPTRSGYAASKHALFGFFDSLRIELEGTGVGVTIIAPDFVLSEIHRRSLGRDGKPLGKSPMQEGKIMTAERCAALIVGAMENRKRLLTSRRAKLGRWVRMFSPRLIDLVAKKAVREGK